MTSTPEATGGKSLISSSLAASLASALKVPLALLCLVSIAIATYYFVYVTDKRTYLVERNFRLLATIGREIESSIETDHRILASLGQHGLQHGQSGTRKTEAVGSECTPLVKNHRFTDCASAFIPILRSATAIAWPDTIKGDVRIQFAEPESPMVWGRRDDTESHDAVVQLEVDELIVPIVRSTLVSSAFDTVLVATTDGRVIEQAGNLDQRITRLDKLTSVTDPKNPAKLEFDTLSRSANMVNVEISGSTYTL